MAKKEAKPEGWRVVFLLVDCIAGKCGEVVEVDHEMAERLLKMGEADDNPAAILAAQK